MDFQAKTAEIEHILQRYANCVSARAWDSATNVRDEFRQAVYMALQSAHVEGYELGLKNRHA